MEEDNKNNIKEESQSNFFGKKLLIGLGAILGTSAAVIGKKFVFDYLIKNKNIYSIDDNALEYKDNYQDNLIFQKLKLQNSYKLTIIDDTNNKKYIRANSMTVNNNDKIEKEFICPITQKIMDEPVITPYGTTYEKSAIIDWINKNQIDYKTENFLSEDMLVTNYILKVAIKEYKESLTQK